MSTNLIIVSGALSKHELRYTPKGTPVLDVVLVGKREVARSHVFFRADLTFYGKMAEAWSGGLQDGAAYQAGGRLEYESWEKDGVKAQRLRLVGDELFTLEEADLRDEGKGPILYGAENRVLLSGNIIADPEVRQTAGKTPVARAQLGFSTWDYSAQQAKSHYAELEAWQTLAAQFAALKKGAAVLVEGSLKTEVWEAKESGAKRYKRVLEAHNITRLSRVKIEAQAA